MSRGPAGRLAARSIGREAVAAEVAIDALPTLPPGARVLVVDDPTDAVAAALRARGAGPVAWSRFSRGARPGAPWPPAGPFDAATLRLPKAREAFEMALQAVAAVLRPGAPLFVYGANDEGIKSAGAKVAAVYDAVATVSTRRHCRVLSARRRAEPPPRPTLEDWARTETLWDRPWAAFPGVFAGGALDPGTALLLDALPPLPAGTRVLDFGCGAGVLAEGIRRASPGVSLCLLDADALAVEAARRNLPGVEVVLSDAFTDLPPGLFHRIVSNPPIHVGKGEDFGVLEALVHGAPARLAPGGELWLVTLRQVPVNRLLAACFAQVEAPHEDRRFRIWRALGQARQDAGGAGRGDPLHRAPAAQAGQGDRRR